MASQQTTAANGHAQADLHQLQQPPQAQPPQLYQDEQTHEYPYPSAPHHSQHQPPFKPRWGRRELADLPEPDATSAAAWTLPTSTPASTSGSVYSAHATGSTSISSSSSVSPTLSYRSLYSEALPPPPQYTTSWETGSTTTTASAVSHFSSSIPTPSPATSLPRYSFGRVERGRSWAAPSALTLTRQHQLKEQAYPSFLYDEEAILLQAGGRVPRLRTEDDALSRLAGLGDGDRGFAGMMGEGLEVNHERGQRERGVLPSALESSSLHANDRLKDLQEDERVALFVLCSSGGRRP